MNKKCPKCKLANFKAAESCIRCNSSLVEVCSQSISDKAKSRFGEVLKRVVICFLVCVGVLVSFYGSLVLSSKPLNQEESERVEKAILILEEKGFNDEVFYLRSLTVFRGSDNWLNASVPKETAFAATNYPFEIVTIYPDFLSYPKDDVEGAAILLHEAKHLQGKDEKEAYKFVWENKKRLGWTKENYKESVVWNEIRKQTKELVPDLFICEFNEYKDCTQ